MRRTSADAGSGRSIHAFEPSVDLALGIVLGNAVALLKPARKLGALALDHIEVVVGELAPLLLNLALELFPVAFHAVPIHGFLLLLGISELAKEPRGAHKSSDSWHLPNAPHRAPQKTAA